LTVLKHVGVMSVGKITALIGLVTGLLYGILFSVFAGAMAAAMPGLGAGGAGAFGVVMVFFMAIGGLIGGFVYGVIMAFLYNIFAGWVGGVQIDLV
jgi:hypothetical protein